MCWRADTRLDERELRRLRATISAHVSAVAEAQSDVLAVEQIVGELIGNVQRYAPGPFCTELHWSDDSLQVSVHDPGPCFVPDRVSVTNPADWEAERGRGIAIIKALGGTIETHRAGDKGCRVSVVVPVKKRRFAEAAPPDCPHGHPATRGQHCPRIQQFIRAARSSNASADSPVAIRD